MSVTKGMSKIEIEDSATAAEKTTNTYSETSHKLIKLSFENRLLSIKKIKMRFICPKNNQVVQ